VKQTFNPRWLLLSLALVLGCADRSFFRVDPPVNAQGISVALVSQTCELEQDFEQQSLFVQDTMLALQITNQSPSAATFDSDKVRLAWSKQTTAPDLLHQLGTIKAGDSTRVQLHFTLKGPDAACNNQTTLTWSDAVTLGAKPVELPPIKFQLSARADP
jgi:hypothetical protein